MPARALVIAIENYPAMQGDFVTNLPGTHASAKRFIDWLEVNRGGRSDNQQVDPAKLQVFVCTDATDLGPTLGPTRKAIGDTVQALYDAGSDGAGTTEFFCFFSGHGFLFNEGVGIRAADVLVAADFRRAGSSGDACFKLQELQHELRTSLGAGDHYYFIDACRNAISERDIAVGSLGVRLPRASSRDAAVYTLFSTSRLSAAPVTSGFAEHLVNGLGGTGRAKVPAVGPPPRMWVTFNSLRGYLKSKLPAIEGQDDGGGDGVLLEIRPIPQNICEVTIANAGQNDRFRVEVTDGLERTIASVDITGPSGSFKQRPDEYYLAASHPTNAVVAVDTPPVDLHENAQFRFEMKTPTRRGRLRGAGPPPPPPPPAGPPVPRTSLSVVAAPGSRIEVRNLKTGEVATAADRFDQRVVPGPHLVKVFDREGVLIAHREEAVGAGQNMSIDMQPAPTPLRLAILDTVPASVGEVHFSETLGATTDPDLGLWLSIIAATRVLGHADFSKLKDMPLRTFDRTPQGASAVYVLAGFDDPAARFRAGLGTSGQTHKWMTTTSVPGFPGLFEASAEIGPGGVLVSFAEGSGAVQTIASFALPNRATVLTVVKDPDGRMRVHQLLLPIGSLIGSLEPEVRNYLPDPPLRAVKLVTQAQRQLARRRPFLAPSGGSEPTEGWLMALHGKWLDPMMAIVACYELIRLGKSAAIDTALGNLRRFFNQIPDTVALELLKNRKVAPAPPAWPPLVIDGLSAFSGASFLPLPEGRLDYRGPWTMWQGAVALP
jgi:hypothetical protein